VDDRQSVLSHSSDDARSRCAVQSDAEPKMAVPKRTEQKTSVVSQNQAATERKGTREYLQVFNTVQRSRGVTTNFGSHPQSNSAVCKLADCTVKELCWQNTA